LWRLDNSGGRRYVELMIDPKLFDDLSQRLAASVPKGVQLLQEDLSRNFRGVIEAGLSRLDLVTREEFDVQQAVLARTRQKLEALERQVAELESRVGVGPPGG
jgi:BMFP domain-containing protein YqiC